MKILCKNCNKDFEYGESLKGRVVFQKCSRVFKIIYDIRIICPSCSNIIQPQNDGSKIVGVTVQEIAKELRNQAQDQSSSFQQEHKRKAKLLKVYEEIKSRIGSKEADTRIVKRGAKSAEEVSAETFGHLSFDNIRDITSASKKVLIPKTQEERAQKPSAKKAKIAKKIVLCLILLGLSVALSNILPDLMYSRDSMALSSSYNPRSMQIRESLPKPGTVVDNSDNVIDLTELTKLFEKGAMEAENKAKEERPGSKEPEYKPLKKQKDQTPVQAPKSRAFKELLAQLNVSSGFGHRIHPITGQKHFHTGIDIPRRYRSPIKAIMSGKVIFSGYRKGYGNLVILEHKGGIKTYYGHNAKNSVLKDDYVKKGDTIGYIGMTGNTTGPHLHFEIRKNNIPINPLNYLEQLLEKYKSVII